MIPHMSWKQKTNFLFFSLGVIFIIEIIIKLSTVQLPTSDSFNKQIGNNEEHPSG